MTSTQDLPWPSQFHRKSDDSAVDVSDPAGSEKSFTGLSPADVAYYNTPPSDNMVSGKLRDGSTPVVAPMPLKSRVAPPPKLFSHMSTNSVTTFDTASPAGGHSRMSVNNSNVPSRVSTPATSVSFASNWGLPLPGKVFAQRPASNSSAHSFASADFHDEASIARGSYFPENYSADSTRPQTGVDSAPHTPSKQKDFRLPAFDLERPSSSRQLEQPQSKIQLKVREDPRRQWLGGVPAPGLNSEQDDEDKNDYGAQTAAPVRPLPPVEQPVDQISVKVDSQPDPAKAIGKGPQIGAVPIHFPTTQFAPKKRLVDVDGSLRKKGRRKILLQKHAMQFWQVGLNAFAIFSTWWWARYYYILLPLITATVALNVIMIFSIIARKAWNSIKPEKIIMPEEPEDMVLLIPCYNETKEELLKSLDSLVRQNKLEKHKQAIMIVCDGKVRGPGMDKTTGDYLLQDILTHRSERKYITGAYTAWDQQPMDVVVQRGKYQGVPYYCIVKQQNQGKRDGLLVARSFLYNFNRRSEAPKTIFDAAFFNDMASFLLRDAGIENVVHLIGMDADTVFDDDCIYELLEQSRYPGTMGVCGYVAVDWKDGRWNPWRLYQSAEYTIAQGLRRLHQSMVTHKVSCLPGCCQLLRICEETCGDRVLLDLFGYCPELTDGLLNQIRATASEDRNHVCHMLIARPQSKTRQALYAKAYTDVPRSWSVFLSQRRRWTLGATSNDLLLVTSPGVQWFERILAAINVSTWFLNPFIFASVASFIYACTGMSIQANPLLCQVTDCFQPSPPGSSCALSASCLSPSSTTYASRSGCASSRASASSSGPAASCTSSADPS